MRLASQPVGALPRVAAGGGAASPARTRSSGGRGDGGARRGQRAPHSPNAHQPPLPPTNYITPPHPTHPPPATTARCCGGAWRWGLSTRCACCGSGRWCASTQSWSLRCCAAAQASALGVGGSHLRAPPPLLPPPPLCPSLSPIDADKAMAQYSAVDPLISARRLPGLFSASSRSPHWRAVRKGVAPAFQPRNLRWGGGSGCWWLVVGGWEGGVPAPACPSPSCHTLANTPTHPPTHAPTHARTQGQLPAGVEERTRAGGCSGDRGWGGRVGG